MCQSKPCRRGERDDFPPYCPGRQLSKEEALGLYDQQDLDSLRAVSYTHLQIREAVALHMDLSKEEQEEHVDKMLAMVGIPASRKH